MEKISKTYLFGSVRYTAVGSIRITTFFGIPIFKAVGNVKWYCGMIVGSNSAV